MRLGDDLCELVGGEPRQQPAAVLDRGVDAGTRRTPARRAASTSCRGGSGRLGTRAASAYVTATTAASPSTASRAARSTATASSVVDEPHRPIFT